jgi:hypothetical protein
MHKSATKCNETLGKWCKNKHGASKIIDTLETYHASAANLATTARLRVVPFPSSLRRACARLRAHPRAPACPLLSSCTSTMRVPLYARSNAAPADPLPAQLRSAASTLLMRIFPRAAPAALPRTRPGGSADLHHSMRARPYAIGDPPPFLSAGLA